MTQPAKFTFATEFASGETGRLKKLEQEIAHLKAQIPQAEARAYAAGKKDAGAELATTLDKALTALSTLDTERTELKKEAIELALITARTLAGKLIDQEPQSAIEGIAAECIDNLRNCPHIVFRVHPETVESVEATLKTLVHERGIEGRLIVLGDPERKLGDCKIEWAEGGVEHRRADVEQKIEEAVKRYISQNLSQDSATLEDAHG